jgi:putative ABC transport system permease protein
MVVMHHVVHRTNHDGNVVTDSAFRDVTVFGVDGGGLGSPAVVDGHAVRNGPEAVVDRSLGYELGDQFDVGPLVVTVVGRTSGATLFAGLANVYVSFDTAQALFSGMGVTEPIANAIVVRGSLRAPVAVSEPQGAVPLRLLSAGELRADILRPLGGARHTIDLVRLLLWIVAGGIVASIVYVTALERTRDFAVFKATGTATSRIFAGILFQALVLALGAGLLSIGGATLLQRAFPVPVTVPGSAYGYLGFLAVAVGALASLAGARRVVTVDPALAFAGA